jgi:hypothetical protein
MLDGLEALAQGKKGVSATELKAEIHALKIEMSTKGIEPPHNEQTKHTKTNKLPLKVQDMLDCL